MKIQLTKKWTPKINKHRHSSYAFWNDVHLDCDCHPMGECIFGPGGHDQGIRWKNKWVGSAQIFGLHHSYRFGKHRVSVALARRDAERLAVELQEDLVEGARRLAKEYCGEE